MAAEDSKPAATGIPFALVGRNVDNAVKIIELLKPEYDVIHFTESISAAAAEFPSLLTPSTHSPAAPAHPIGSNASRPSSTQRAPRAILVGAGFSDPQYEELRVAIGAQVESEGVMWIRERPEDIQGLEFEESWVVVHGKGRFPKPEVIARGMRGVLGRHLGC